MKRQLQRVAVAVGTLLALFLAFPVIEHPRGRWTLSRHLAALRSRGEVLSVAALEPRRPPAEQNRAITLLRKTLPWERMELMTAAIPPPPGPG